MDEAEKMNEAKEAKEIYDLINSYLKLQDQLKNPTRFGMIEALSSAQNVARQEITDLEKQQGDIYPMLWTDFQDQDLYRKLRQYQQGLYRRAVNRLGEEAFKKIVKEYTKES